MKLAWLTDVHLNFLDANERKKFYKEIINTKCDGILVSGDIAEACLHEAYSLHQKYLKLDDRVLKILPIFIVNFCIHLLSPRFLQIVLCIPIIYLFYTVFVGRYWVLFQKFWAYFG